MLRMHLAAALLATPGTAHAAWQKATSKHFIVYADDAPAKVQAFATRMELADKAMRVLRSVGDPVISAESRVTVIVVPDVATVNRLASTLGARNVSGIYLPRASTSIALVPRRGEGDGPGKLSAQAVLLHEYAHHFMFSALGGSVYPAWLVEGFAEFNATMTFEKDGSVSIGRPPLYDAYGIIEGSNMPIMTLLTAEPNSLPDNERAMFYGRGWLLTHYLTLDEGRRGNLARYLAALNQGAEAKDAAKMLGDPGKLNRDLDRYTRTRLNIFKIPAAKLTIAPVTVDVLTPGAAAVMPAMIASLRGVDGKTAATVAAQARKLAAPFPTDAAAQNELAEAEHDAGNYADAQAAADRALAADPKSIHAMMYAGLARLAIASRADNPDPAMFDAARRWFRKANHAEPEYAWPLQMYYQSYVIAKQRPTTNAEEGLLYARELAPYDAGLGMTAAHIQLQRGKNGEAARLLKPIAYDPHGNSAATIALKALTLIDQQDAAAALAWLDNPNDRPAPAQ